MNARIYKKKCKRAMRELVKTFGIKESRFSRSKKNMEYVTSDGYIVYLKKGTLIVDYRQFVSGEIVSADDELASARLVFGILKGIGTR